MDGLSRPGRWLLVLLLGAGCARGQAASQAWGHEAWTTENGLPQNSVHAVLQTRDGYVWAATEGGLARFNGVGFTVFSEETTPGFGSGDLCCLAEDREGALLVGGADGVRRYSGGRFVRASGAVAAGAAALRDSRGRVWVGTRRGLMLDGVKVAALGENSVLAIAEDREGDIWVGTDTGGLHVLRPQAFRGALVGEAVTAVVQAQDGAMWVGTRGDGLFRLLGDKTRHWTAKDGLLSDVILSLAADRDGSVWVGTPDGLDRLRGGKVKAMTAADGLPDDFVRCLYVDVDRSLWVGTRRGLAHLAAGKTTMLGGLPSELIGAVLRVGNGDLWVGTSGGVARVRDGRVQVMPGVLGGIVTALVESEGTVWVGTKDGGVSRLDGERFLGVAPGEVEDLVADDRGGLWMTGSHGVTRVVGGRVVRFGAADGMPSEEASSLGHPSAWKAVDGTVWFGTRKGLGIVDPAGLQAVHVPVPVVVEHFTVDDAPWKGGERIPPGHTRFAFEYAGLSYAAPSRVTYRYRLDGFEKEWVEAGARRNAFYTNLGAGRYRMLVEAAGTDGVWGEPAAVGFVVWPRFYRTWWFLGLMGLLIVGIGALGYWLRVRALRSRFDAILAERNRMAREIHDTLAQGFVGVSLQLEITGNLLAGLKVDEAKTQVDQAKALVREGLADARQSIWELRSGAVEAGLPERMRQMVDRVGGERGEVDLSVGGTYRAVAAEVEREVLRIAQEAVTNAVRHAGAGRVVVELRYEAEALRLSVMDDGAGFVVDEVRSGRFGLVGMKERAERIHGELEIVSTPGSGTALRLRVSLAA